MRYMILAMVLMAAFPGSGFSFDKKVKVTTVPIEIKGISLGNVGFVAMTYSGSVEEAAWEICKPMEHAFVANDFIMHIAVTKGKVMERPFVMLQCYDPQREEG